MTTLIIARRADAQIRTIEAWWVANREKAPDLFAEELVRVLLVRSRYHVYFSYDVADVVKVRAVWHARRGRGPALR